MVDKEVFWNSELRFKNYIHIECSSKNNTNIDTIFELILNKIYDELKGNKIKFDDSNGIQVYKNSSRINTLTIEETNIKKKPSKFNKGCCTIL